tara:strand:- start:471 stop:1142 length:672 start_codon:yes stop_codon:yes gene_type:complete
LAKRLSEEQKEKIIKIFAEGFTIDEISKQFNYSKLTITRHLKKNFDDSKYKELIDKSKYLKKSIKTGEISNTAELNKEDFNHKDSNEKFSVDDSLEAASVPINEFIELAPLNDEIDHASRKDLSSISINDIELPNTVYMIVEKTTELEVKLLKNFTEWQFLSYEDLNRKTIQIFFDLKVAKRNCNKDQKVIKVPNTNVFKIVSPILISRGITRIVSEDQLIAL